MAEKLQSSGALVQCARCSGSFKNRQMLLHLGSCAQLAPKKQSSAEKPVELKSSGSELQVLVLQSLIKLTLSNASYVSFSIQLSQGDKVWHLDKDYSQLLELQQSLVYLYPDFAVMISPLSLLPADLDLSRGFSGTEAKQLKCALQQFLTRLAEIPKLLHSVTFERFLELERTKPSIIGGEISSFRKNKFNLPEGPSLKNSFEVESLVSFRTPKDSAIRHLKEMENELYFGANM